MVCQGKISGLHVSMWRYSKVRFVIAQSQEKSLDIWAVFIEFFEYVERSFTEGTDLLKWLQRVKSFWLAMTLEEFWQL